MLAVTARWTMREPQFERVDLGDRISVSGWVDSERRRRRPNILVLPSFGANLLMSVIEALALTARRSFVPRRGPFQRLIVERLASALGRLIEDPDLRRRPREDEPALPRTRLDVDVCAERLVTTWTESVHAGER
jgi:glycosyltransferase involved in cell wall biosynthesis